MNNFKLRMKKKTRPFFSCCIVLHILSVAKLFPNKLLPRHKNFRKLEWIGPIQLHRANTHLISCSIEIRSNAPVQRPRQIAWQNPRSLILRAGPFFLSPFSTLRGNKKETKKTTSTLMGKSSERSLLIPEFSSGRLHCRWTFFASADLIDFASPLR